MQEFVTYVPLTYRNRRVFSPKLAEILVSASIQIEATFKDIINSDYIEHDENIDSELLEKARKAINDGRSNIAHYRELLEPYFMLSRRKVDLMRRPRLYRTSKPFARFSVGRAPLWWDSYNKVKHSFYVNAEDATMRDTFTALSALFVLHIMHLSHRSTLIDLGVIRSGNRAFEKEGHTRSALKKILLASPRQIPRDAKIPDVWAETEFFEMDFYGL